MRYIIAIIAIMLLALAATSCSKKEVQADRIRTVEGARVDTIRQEPVDDYYEAVGTVRSKSSSVISSRIVGSVLAIHVHEGDHVRAGQTLIEIDDRDSRTQVQKAQAGLREAQDAIDEIERNTRGAESAKTAAEANRQLAFSTYNRYRALLDRKSVSPQEFEEVQARYRVAEAEVERADRAIQSLAARRNQVMARIDQAKADLAGARVYAGYSRITAPISGVVTAKPVDVGFTASPGQPLLTIEDDASYRLEASVEESRLGRIRTGDTARVVIDALGPNEIAGTVAEIVPASDASSRSYTVKIEIPAAGLRSGLFGKARFVMGQTRSILIPARSLVERGQLQGVMAVDESGIARLRLIRTGKQYGDRVEVLSGINEGDRIVVEGADRVGDGNRVL